MTLFLLFQNRDGRKQALVWGWAGGGLRPPGLQVAAAPRSAHQPARNGQQHPLSFCQSTVFRKDWFFSKGTISPISGRLLVLHYFSKCPHSSSGVPRAGSPNTGLAESGTLPAKRFPVHPVSSLSWVVLTATGWCHVTAAGTDLARCAWGVSAHHRSAASPWTP